MPQDAFINAGQASASNLSRIMEGLSRGLHLPAHVDGQEVVGFVVRLDDAPFGPVAVVHVPDGRHLRILYRDPDELSLIAPPDTLRIP